MANYAKIKFHSDSFMSDLEISSFQFKYGLSAGDTSFSSNFNKDNIYTFPLRDDLPVEAESQYQKLSDIFSIVGRIQNITTAAGGLFGQVFSNNLNNLFNAEMWKETSPVSIPLKLFLYTKTNPAFDVYFLAQQFVAQTIISDVKGKDGKTKYLVPGIPLGGLGKIQQKVNKDKKQTAGGATSPAPASASDGGDKPELDKIIEDTAAEFDLKFISVFIPGIIYLDKAIIKTAKPVFSKQSSRIAGQDFPIWCEMDVMIQSIEAARISMFKKALDKPPF